MRAMVVEEWLSSEPPQLYDAIVAMDLIEHLRKPTETIRELVQTRLKPGGKFVITTPNANSLSRRCMGSVWPHYKVEHLTYPSEAAMRSMARASGLYLDEVSSLAKPLQIEYLITVLRNFGPQSLRVVGAALNVLTPTALRGCHVRIPSGEILVVATKHDAIKP